MAVFDVRKDVKEEVDEIVFAEMFHQDWRQVYSVMPRDTNVVRLNDGEDMMFIVGKQHAVNLIKALNKAIEMGWLK